MPTHGIYYPHSKKATTSCLRINAYCYYCKKADSKTAFGKYSITVNQSDEFDIMKVIVKHSEHNHQAIFAQSSSSASEISSSSLHCHTEKQLECVIKTDYHDRILHVDATGSLVKINQKQDNYSYPNYKRILNYFCILKVS